MRRLYLYLLILSALILSACAPQPPIPTVAVLPTDPPVSPTPAHSPTPAPPTATLPPSPTPGPSATPTITPTPDPNAIRFDYLPVKFQQKRVTFMAWITPLSAAISAIQLHYRYPSTGEELVWDAPVPIHTLGEQFKQPLQFSFDIGTIPPTEDRILYQWQVILESGGTISSPEQTFKMTEAINSERLDHLPIIAADTSFESQFPEAAILTAKLRPASRIMQAQIVYTQNRGLELHQYNIRIPTHESGDLLELQFRFTDQLAIQIPWQQLEWWFVVRDQNNKQWRTAPVFSEYADNRFHRWTRTETEHAVLFTYDQNAASIGILKKATDESIRNLERVFGYKLIYTPHIVLYNNTRDFREWSSASADGQFIGLASSEWGGAVIAFYESLEFTGYGIIQHELTHLFQYQSFRDRRRQDVPKWWIEGTARYFEQYFPWDMEAYLRALYQSFPPPRLDMRLSERAPDGSDVSYPYVVGMTFVTFFLEEYGEKAFQQVHVSLARLDTFPNALKLATGKTLSELSQAWQAWIKE
ncbi:MAG: hypothetical protein IT322_10185 [Anaerolineae bacterium]|nr:hypothetical protein [Anaerolineae bacterium]